MKFLMMLVCLFGLMACSGKSVSENQKTADVEDILIEDSSSSEDFLLEDESLSNDNIETLAEEKSIDEDEVIEEDSVKPDIASTGVFDKYRVQKGDTLMMISFKVYGDYSRWKELAQNNPGVVKGSVVYADTNIQYERPAEAFDWNPEGQSYLIVSGDTLGKISQKNYGSAKYWKPLWVNNKPLIQDPNKIFAGFTIYYKDMDSVKRDLASLK